MNGTKIRTLLVIASSINTALLATDITDFNNPTLSLIYKVATVVSDFVVVACATYFNNDFTVEGETGTKICREMKKNRMKVAYVPEPEDSEVE